MQTRWLSRAALFLVTVYLLIAIPVGLRNTFVRLRVAAKTAGVPVQALRPRVFGREYVTVIDQIRRTIPEGQPYLLSELTDPGSLLWVRFDLLPRRAIVVRSGGSPDEGFDCWREQVRWEVVSTGTGRPPLFRERPATVPPGCPRAPWMGTER
ncbi:MAG: hypothetical protein QOF89_1869 [Acidobacteriota bacterium]|jgi:hypothetical protein|nr:hypothetical protein [Acidobacteriota bacterium]